MHQTKFLFLLIIEAVKWDTSPEMTFLEIGNRMTFARYFNPKKEILPSEIQIPKFEGLEITNLKQPLLLCRSTCKVRSEPVLLVPELCLPTNECYN